MKSIGIGVGGRFHSDFMYQALSGLGYSTSIYTSLPKKRFPSFARPMTNCVWPEVIYRVAKNIGLESSGDALKMKFFGRFLSRQMREARPDLFIGWSSFSLETLKNRPANFHVLMRDSTHIQFQYDLLAKEYEKFGFRFPNRNFCLERELEEYELADQIWVLSDFARETFIHQGISGDKVKVLPLGVDLERFKPIEKWPAPSPLRVVYFGIISFRKGVQYLLEATKNFSPQQIELNLIGAVEPEFKETLAKYNHFNYRQPLPQNELAKEIRNHHAFVFPTLEDGFGQTLIQAMASGLVPITTTHCGAADFTFLKSSPWRIPAGSVKPIEESLEVLIKDPQRLKELRELSIRTASQLSWEKYGLELGRLVSELAN